MSRFAPADGAMRIVTAEILDQLKDNALLMLDSLIEKTNASIAALVEYVDAR